MTKKIIFSIVAVILIIACIAGCSSDEPKKVPYMAIEREPGTVWDIIEKDDMKFRIKLDKMYSELVAIYGINAFQKDAPNQNDKYSLITSFIKNKNIKSSLEKDFVRIDSLRRLRKQNIQEIKNRFSNEYYASQMNVQSNLDKFVKNPNLGIALENGDGSFKAVNFSKELKKRGIINSSGKILKKDWATNPANSDIVSASKRSFYAGAINLSTNSGKDPDALKGNTQFLADTFGEVVDANRIKNTRGKVEVVFADIKKTAPKTYAFLLKNQQNGLAGKGTNGIGNDFYNADAGKEDHTIFNSGWVKGELGQKYSNVIFEEIKPTTYIVTPTKDTVSYSAVYQAIGYGELFAKYKNIYDLKTDEDRLAREQGFGEKLAYGVTKMFINIFQTLGQNIIYTQNTPEAILKWDKSIFHKDEDYIKSEKKKVQFRYKHYYTTDEAKYNFIEKIGTANFWTDKVMLGIGAVIGYVLYIAFLMLPFVLVCQYIIIPITFRAIGKNKNSSRANIEDNLMIIPYVATAIIVISNLILQF